MQNKPQMVEAVVFFKEHGVGKQMRYPEFEALLDGVVNLPEFADQQVKAVYVVINPRLQLKACVFFYLDFDQDGAADRGWNIPLPHLAAKAGRGPDLGAGPIRLACRSQCPVSWHQMHLWDPSLSPERNDLALLRDAVKRNHLGILVEEEEVPAFLPARFNVAAEDKWYTSDAAVEEEAEPASPMPTVRLFNRARRDKTARWIRQQRLRLTTLKRLYEREFAMLKMQAQQQLAQAQQQTLTVQKQLEQQQALNASLKAQLDAQAESFQRSREQLSEQLREIERNGRLEGDVLRSQWDMELQAKLAAAATDYREQIAVRDVELAYRNELDIQLQAEIQALRAERDQVMRQSGDQVLEKLSALGMVFVVYHPGAGHLTVPLQELAVYQANPMAYAANKCLVSEDQYRQWLSHYQDPRCQGRLSNDQRCALPLDRVDSPSRYLPGDSDCCARHKASARSRSAL